MLAAEPSAAARLLFSGAARAALASSPVPVRTNTSGTHLRLAGFWSDVSNRLRPQSLPAVRRENADPNANFLLGKSFSKNHVTCEIESS
jgi:hypothetical protein